MIPLKEKIHIITDCDGIMTSANITYAPEGKRQKHFSVNDSLIVDFFRERYPDRFELIVLTGDSGAGLEVTKSRLAQIGVNFAQCKNVYKYAYIKENYDISKVIYIGDDIYDFAIFKECLYSCTVSNAPEIVKKHARYVSPYEGGKNGFTDIMFKILDECWISYEEDLLDFIKQKEKEYNERPKSNG